MSRRVKKEDIQRQWRKGREQSGDDRKGAVRTKWVTPELSHTDGKVLCVQTLRCHTVRSESQFQNLNNFLKRAKQQ